MPEPLPTGFAEWVAQGQEDEYWRVDGLEDRQLEQQLRAAYFVARGGSLLKFCKSGREKPHKRLFKVAAPSNLKMASLSSRAKVWCLGMACVGF